MHLYDDLDYSRGVPPSNHGRLLVHPPGSWALRPEAASAIPNLTLASDYVRTHTDLASMEGANEAARRAVNAILDRTGSTAPRAGVWPLSEPEGFEPWKKLDKLLYDRGRPHLFEMLGIRKAAQAADMIRRFTEFTGIDKLDDLLDSVRATEIIKALLARFGIE